MFHIVRMAQSEIAATKNALSEVWYGARFPARFLHDRPFGAGDGAIHFFHFRNEVMLQDNEGHLSRPPGTAILYATDAHQRFEGVTASEKPWLCDHVIFPPSTLVRLAKLGIPLNAAFSVSHPHPVMDTILNLRTEERRAKAHWRAAAQAYRSVLMLQLARETSSATEAGVPEGDAAVERIVRDVCAMIDRNPTHPWVIAELASLAGMSRGRFSTQFKRIMDLSPQEYAINARLREARVLLTNTSLSVTEVAERCGFRSAYYMSRLFSSRIGCPPSRYAERFQVDAV